MFEATQEICAQAGLPAYEISNHARPGAESRHNLTYWQYGDYAGVGPGAHGRITSAKGRVATQAERLPEKWLTAVEGSGSSLSIAHISDQEGAQEHLLMALRLSEGLDLDAYRARWGTGPSRQTIATLQQQGLLALQNNHLAATAAGRLVLNSIIRALSDMEPAAA